MGNVRADREGVGLEPCKADRRFPVLLIATCSGDETEGSCLSGRCRLKAATSIALACLGLFGACSRPTPSSPTPVPAAPNSVTETIDGWVQDNVGRPVVGATVELIDGVPAGLSAITDGSGSFSLGEVTLTTGNTKLRTSKDGFAPSVQLAGYNASAHISEGIVLWSLTPPVIGPGDYTMSFVADSACDLPEAARTRTYSATVTLPSSSGNLPPERRTNFDVALSGASFVVGLEVSPTSSLTVAADADYLVFLMDPWDTGEYITERLAPATFVQLTGSVAGSMSASGLSSLPFDGTFTYCVKASDAIIAPDDPAVHRFVGCLTTDPVYKWCHSTRARVVLTRR